MRPQVSMWYRTLQKVLRYVTFILKTWKDTFQDIINSSYLGRMKLSGFRILFFIVLSYLILFCYDTVVLPLGNKCFIYCMVFLMTLSAIFFLCFSLLSNCPKCAKEPSWSQLPKWTLKFLCLLLPLAISDTGLHCLWKVCFMPLCFYERPLLVCTHFQEI